MLAADELARSIGSPFRHPYPQTKNASGYPTAIPLQTLIPRHATISTAAFRHDDRACSSGNRRGTSADGDGRLFESCHNVISNQKDSASGIAPLRQLSMPASTWRWYRTASGSNDTHAFRLDAAAALLHSFSSPDYEPDSPPSASPRMRHHQCAKLRCSAIHTGSLEACKKADL